MRRSRAELRLGDDNMSFVVDPKASDDEVILDARAHAR